MAAYVRDGYGIDRTRVCGDRQNFYVFTHYRNPDLDNLIYECLLTSMAGVQAVDVRASFLYVCGLNGYH